MRCCILSSRLCVRLSSSGLAGKELDRRAMAEAPGFAGGAADWSTGYARFLLRAAGRSAGTVQLYNQVLGCLSRGQLEPAALRDSLSRFLQARGGDCSGRAAELTARLFAGLVRMAAGGEPEGADTGDGPPSFDSTDPGDWFRRLGEHTVELHRRRVEAYQAAIHRTAAGEMTPDELRQAMSADEVRWLPERLNHTVLLCFDLLEGLTELTAGYADEYLRGLLAIVKPGGVDAEFVLGLSALAGETASASLSLANTREHRAVIRCAVSDVRRADGVGPAFAPEITIVPDGLLLKPAEEADVRLSLRLDPAVYDPDAAYVGALHVTRQGEPCLEVALVITAIGSAKETQ
jgi:hypothetical protein